MDQGIEEKLKGEQDSVHNKLTGLGRGRRALRGYVPRRTIPRFLDRRL